GFENSLGTYTGDDPLDPWDKFIEYLEKRLPAEDAKGMSLVFNRLVEKFLHDERYSNDGRYLNYCIKCASYYAEPISLYSYIHSKGVGTRSAVLYVAWAQQFEQRGMNDRADAVYQRAVENQAQPADTVLHEYRSSETGGRNPLQDSHLVNQMSSHREPAAQNKLNGISRSENSGVSASGNASGLQTMSFYRKDDLVCEGSELCFEEVRAARYFLKLKQEKERREFEARQKKVREEEEYILSMKRMLEDLDLKLAACGTSTSHPAGPQGPAAETAARLNSDPVQRPFGCPQPSDPLSSMPPADWRAYSQQGFNQGTSIAPAPHQLHDRPRASFTNTLALETSHRRSVLADRSVCSSESTTPSVFAAQPFPTQASPVQTGQQPVTLEQSSLVPRRPAYVSGVNSDVHHPGDGGQPGGPLNPLALSSQQQGTRDQYVPVNNAAEPEEKLDVSQGGTGNLSHITPNTSLGLFHATPSRALPSPTVNTREALGVIMDMFQAPTFLDDPFSNTALHQAAEDSDTSYRGDADPSSFTKPPSTMTPFTIFQDDGDKENCSAAAPVAVKTQPAKTLVEIPVSKPDRPNETCPELIPDESTMWGARYNSLAACPNSTRDFALSAQLVSTPFTCKAPYFSDSYQDPENSCPVGFTDADENAYIRQVKKLSPIIEQSPSDDTFFDPAVGPMRVRGPAEHGTIVGEGLAGPAHHSLAVSSLTVVHPPPPTVLSFRDQTLFHTDVVPSRSPPGATGPSWDVYMSPEQPPKPVSPLPVIPDGFVKPRCQPLTIKKDLDRPASPEQAQMPLFDIPMSPEYVPKPEWLAIGSPVVSTVPDLDAFVSPQRDQRSDAFPRKTLDVPMTPEQPKFCSDVPMSPFERPQRDAMDIPMSPDRGPKVSADVPMSPAVPRSAAAHLISDPWDNYLTARLLSGLSPPLSSHPHCITWGGNIPSITPKTTITMGEASLRVDFVLGEGAFATVYQAIDRRTSEKMVLKVQKPANPWEFYIDTQLDARLHPGLRHLYNKLHAAHLFHNGSVLLGELHNCGTLLNAVNMYRKLSDKVMPQPLVMYFTVCILRMVEELHSVHIIHADVTPDNFLLGKRFLESKCFDSENLDHGLALIDLGQSIDMELYPEGTAFTAKCMTSGFQCTEMLSGRPWNYQTDYFGIAGTVYCMLFGTYMQVKNEDGVWKTNATFRRNPHSDLWLEFFHTLLNIPDCGSLPCLRSLRSRLTSVLQENYHNKLPSLKNRLVVMLLEDIRSTKR
ncbi:mitotic checkpoint serine/threonine-protein kinase BUB1-like, partial [Polymixia lowei]